MSILSKYKEFQEYVDKVIDFVGKEIVYSESWSEAEFTVIYAMATVLESYIVRDKPKDCAKKILGEDNV